MLWGSGYGGFWPYWQLYHKVTFDGPNKLIRINYPETEIDVTVDIYSDWKEWVRIDDNAKYEPALEGVGGNPLPVEGLFLDATFFLINGWRVRTWDEGPHSVGIIGNLFTDVGETPYVAVPGATYSSTVSNIVRRIQDEQQNLPQEDLDAIADAVWSAMSVDFGNIGSMGSVLLAIAELVSSDSVSSIIWDAYCADHAVPDTFGAEIVKKKLMFNAGPVSKQIN